MTHTRVFDPKGNLVQKYLKNYIDCHQSKGIADGGALVVLNLLALSKTLSCEHTELPQVNFLHL